MINESPLQLSAPPVVSVVIPTWNRLTLLEETLTSLSAQSRSDFEVIVVSDGEDHAMRTFAAGFRPASAIRWIFHSENRGQAAARNTGAAAAFGDFLLFLDDDTPAAPDLLAQHIARHLAVSAQRNLAVVGKITELRREPLPQPTDRFLQEARRLALEDYARRLSATGAESVGAPFETSVAFGLNCSVRRSVFLSSGGFNESLRVTDEDMELGLRLYLSGVEAVYEPAAVVHHNGTRDLTAYLKRCWAASGNQDVHRVFTFGEKTSQSRRLLATHHGYYFDRLLSRWRCRTASPALAFAEILEKSANRAGSRFLLSAWSRTAESAAYWNSVKAAGCTLGRLKSITGAPKCALMLHSIADPQSKDEAAYYISPKRFHTLMRSFLARGYKTATLQQWRQDAVPDKHVLLTFDDAYDDLYDELLPLVIQHRYTPVIFLVADRIGASNIWDQANGLRARNLLTLDQTREMQQYGVEFGSHTLTHPLLPNLSDSDLQREVRDSKTKLEDLLGVEIVSFAYPYGGIDRRVRSAVAAAGYKLAFTTLPGTNFWNDPLCQNRADINDRTSLLDFVTALGSGYGFMQSISTRLQHLERQLPTSTLRGAAHGLRRLGHHTRSLLARKS